LLQISANFRDTQERTLAHLFWTVSIHSKGILYSCLLVFHHQLETKNSVELARRLLCMYPLQWPLPLVSSAYLLPWYLGINITKGQPWCMNLARGPAGDVGICLNWVIVISHKLFVI
jgi:hypothetical protein